KSLFLLWLYLPSTHGASQVYYKLIKPIFVKHHASIDQRVSHMADKARDALRSAAKEVENHLD
ncbi:hypothetical protein OESDEN_23625, partial [Oesophagostomum dentatum]